MSTAHILARQENPVAVDGGWYHRRIMAKQAARPRRPRRNRPKRRRSPRTGRRGSSTNCWTLRSGDRADRARRSNPSGPGGVNLRDAYVASSTARRWRVGAHICPTSRRATCPHEPDRPRKLLLHEDEIVTLRVQTQTKGLTIVPLRLYLKGRRAKSRSPSARARNSTTNAPPWPSATPAATSSSASEP